MSVQAFYDELAPLYHLVYENWEASVARQGTALASLIREHWGAGARTVLDAAVGIGTQALGLLPLGFRVTGSDLSHAAVNRAQREAATRHLPLTCLVADFRALPVRAASVDVVIVCDNSLPHLETPRDIETALGECFRCARPGGDIREVRDAATLGLWRRAVAPWLRAGMRHRNASPAEKSVTRRHQSSCAEGAFTRTIRMRSCSACSANTKWRDAER